jgi:hypothetical protein
MKEVRRFEVAFAVANRKSQTIKIMCDSGIYIPDSILNKDLYDFIYAHIYCNKTFNQAFIAMSDANPYTQNCVHCNEPRKDVA